jgi:hypothetical protein
LGPFSRAQIGGAAKRARRTAAAAIFIVAVVIVAVVIVAVVIVAVFTATTVRLSLCACRAKKEMR